MLFKIGFLSWTGKAALEIEIPDDTKEWMRARIALEIAVRKRADLSGADLSGADLRSADLRSAVLSGAVLSGAVLSSAVLRSAVLSSAVLRSAVLSDFSVCPEVGSFTAFKKLRKGRIATLEVPADARRVSQPKSRKCRAEFVKVLAIHTVSGHACKSGEALHDGTRYEVGEIVRPDSYNDDIREECTNGIHFYITRREAENH